MKNISATPEEFAELRKRAEAQLKEIPESTSLSPEDVRKLLHELQIRQVELEMQNQELRYAETRAEANLKRYTDIYELAPIGYLSFGHDGSIFTTNPACKAMLGYGQSKIVGQNIKNFVSTESQAALKNFLHEAFLIHETGLQQIGCELTLSGKNGTIRHIHVEGLSAEGGGECRVTVTDITERRKSEDALKREGQINKALLQVVRDGICIFDSEGKVVQVNDAFCRMLGYTQEELLSMTIAQWNTQWEIDELKDRIENLKSSDPVFETKFRRRDGGIMDVEVSASSVVINGQRLILNAVRETA